jgi:hypothetical protein
LDPSGESYLSQINAVSQYKLMIVEKAMKNESTDMQFFFAFIIGFAMMFVEGESFLLLRLPRRKTFDLPPANHFFRRLCEVIKMSISPVVNKGGF